MTATLTAEPIFGRALTLKECVETISQFSLEAPIKRLSLLKHANEAKITHSNVTEADRAKHISSAIRFLFPPALRGRVWEEAKADATFRPFSDQALLATMELALRCCPRDAANDIDNDEKSSRFAHVLLSFQSALFSDAFTTRIRTSHSLGDVPGQQISEFIRNSMAHNTAFDTRNALGRLFGLCTIKEVSDFVLEKTNASLDSWFQETFQLSALEYLSCAFLSAGPALRIDYNKPLADDLFLTDDFWETLAGDAKSKTKHLLDLAAQDVAVSTNPPTGTIEEFMYDAVSFYVRPVLRMGGVSLCTSSNLMLRKFLVGIPYLAFESRERTLKRALAENERKQFRAPFGHAFEAYSCWLIRQLLTPQTNTKIFPNAKYGENNECDIVLVSDDTAVCIECKASMPSLALRRSGAFAQLDAMLKVGSMQSYKAALAMRCGEMKSSSGDAIEAVRYVIPCVLSYDDIPLSTLSGPFYERHLAGVAKMPLFAGENGIEAVQFFDIDFVESWESRLDFSPSSRALFGYLLQRARSLSIRYRSIQDGYSTNASPGSPKVFEPLVEASKAFLNGQREWFLRGGPQQSTAPWRGDSSKSLGVGR